MIRCSLLTSLYSLESSAGTGRRFAIVPIAESRASSTEQVQMYADWFGPWNERVFEQLRIDREQYDSIIASIREAKDLRKAFLAA